MELDRRILSPGFAHHKLASMVCARAWAQDAINDVAQRRKEEQAEYDRVQEVYREGIQDAQPDLVKNCGWAGQDGMCSPDVEWH